jgi:protein gp37
MCDFAEDHPVANVERKRLWRTIKATPALTWLLLTKRPERLPEILPYDWEDGPYTAWHNVWLMTSVEDMRAIERVDHLLKVPAIVHGLSIEPLIGPVTLTGRGYNDIEWVIIGGESAQQGKYRPMQKRWLDDLLSECYQKTSVFVKQMGTEWAKRYGYADKKGGDWSEWSEDYRIRFHPTPNIRRIIA